MAPVLTSSAHQVTWDTDVEYEFGGHIWAGRIDWLRKIWSHPPPILYNAEDFWMSAVLRRFYGVRTRRPRCPQPGRDGSLDWCACSMRISADHVPPELGLAKGDGDRNNAIRSIIRSRGGVCSSVFLVRFGD